MQKFYSWYKMSLSIKNNNNSGYYYEYCSERPILLGLKIELYKEL